MGYLTLMPTHLIASQDALAFGDSKAVGLAAVGLPTYLDADVLGGLEVAARRADELATDDAQQERQARRHMATSHHLPHILPTSHHLPPTTYRPHHYLLTS